MIAAWLLASALAAEPAACPEEYLPLPDQLSVVWVSPVRKRAHAKTLLPVVATQDLREWMAKEQPSVGRLLQRLGMRKKSKEPKRKYKVVIFDIRSGDLCRPMDTVNDGTGVSGLPSCLGGSGNATRKYSGCGFTTDQKTGARAFDLYRIPWAYADSL